MRLNQLSSILFFCFIGFILSCIQEKEATSYRLRYIAFAQASSNGQPLDSVQIKLYGATDTGSVLVLTNAQGIAEIPSFETSQHTFIFSAYKPGYKMISLQDEVPLDTTKTSVQRKVEFKLEKDTLPAIDSLRTQIQKLLDSLTKVNNGSLSKDTVIKRKSDSLTLLLDSLKKTP